MHINRHHAFLFTMVQNMEEGHNAFSSISIQPYKKMEKKTNIDWIILTVPLLIVFIVSAFLLAMPATSLHIVDRLWDLFVNKLGFFYVLLGFGMVVLALYLAFSRYGNVRLGNLQKPRHSTFAWGAMIFTATMAADILYWALIEWAYYFNAAPFGMRELSLLERQDWAGTYPLFHWGITPWALHIVPAVAFGYMIHVRKNPKHKLSQACRPILGSAIDGWVGKVIDIFAIVGLIAGTATTFSLATPLLSMAVSSVFGLGESKLITLGVLVVIAAVYTTAVLLGLKGISYLASMAVGIFLLFIAGVFLAGPKIYILETGISGIGKMLNNFFDMSLWMDPLRLSGDPGAGFPQQWTIFYWAYWIAWFVATPFFVGVISEGRTIKNVILGGLACGIAGSYTSFIVLGNYGLHLETQGIYSAASALQTMDPSQVIQGIMQTLPFPRVFQALLIVTMIALYASTFDAITLIVAGYSQQKLHGSEEPSKYLRAFWSLVFIILPAALILSESDLTQLKSLSIIAAFPLGLITIAIVTGLVKELRSGIHKTKLK